ncbi:restriction endonuclease subunit S [Burkholderia cepacia]|uniref:restriction endonuclease subunit S n=1 Tax=Burkholderia cepacia TaxID=292 RepID=UPI00190837B9|nr:restriction endonuclease subunit S [Burkholderia cepacia]MBJ9756238.1 restriction endonuclease subunit S [Burkholderia cepacia]MDC6104079.1 restriction endonuclease subunit S [Burkholderia cepacia]
MDKIGLFRELVSTLSNNGVPGAYRAALTLLAEIQHEGSLRSNQLSLPKPCLDAALETTKSHLAEVLDWVSLSDTARRRGEAMLTPDIAQLLADLVIEGGHSRAIILQDPLCLVASRLVNSGIFVEQYCSDFEVPKLCAEIASTPAWTVAEGGIYGDSPESNRGRDGRTDDGVLIAALPLIPGVSGGAHVKQLPYAASEDLHAVMLGYGASVTRLIVLVPSSMLYRTGKAAEFRRDLLSAGLVESVLELPSGTTPLATHQYSALVLRPFQNPVTEQSVFVMNLPEQASPATRGRGRRVEVESSRALAAKIVNRRADDGDNGRLISYRQAQEVGSLLPRMLLGDTSADAYHAGGQTALRDLVRIVRPIALPEGTRRPSAAVTTESILRAFPYICYVETRGGPDGESERGRAHETAADLEAEDIIIVVKGTVGAVGLVEQPTNGLILLPNSCLVLRAKSPAEAKAIYLYLKSPTGIERLRSIVTGSTVRNIRIADLNGLAVPIPTDHTCAIAVNSLKAINEKTVEIQRLEVERAQLLADSLQEISRTGDLFGA